MVKVYSVAGLTTTSPHLAYNTAYQSTTAAALIQREGSVDRARRKEQSRGHRLAKVRAAIYEPPLMACWMQVAENRSQWRALGEAYVQQWPAQAVSRHRLRRPSDRASRVARTARIVRAARKL
ncbi:unnamed protein product [Chrysodeixis includens]|uniref:Uncharacterized protein n=1 Tax=Chrysodeixis includens TaxID=689277 RepID=A0A9N8Q352_CHRIL|nr:unnamed protein product [Chrysodeixis includens]